MKKIALLLMFAFISIPLMGFMVSIQTIGNYGFKSVRVQISVTPTTTMQIAALTAIAGNASNNKPFVGVWYSTNYGIVPNPNNDASYEPITINYVTPVATLTDGTGTGWLILAPRRWPNWKIHKDRYFNAIAFEVQATGTVTKTATMTSTATATNSSTMTPTNSATNTATQTATNTATYTGTRTPINTATVTTTNTITKTPTISPTATNTFTVTPSYTPTIILATKTWTPIPTNTWTNTPTGTLTPSVTPTPTCTCAASWTPACFNQ